MEKINHTEPNDPAGNPFWELPQAETILLKWIEVVAALISSLVLVHLLFFSPIPSPIKGRYIVMIATEITILLLSIFLYAKGRLVLSSYLLILFSLAGPWWVVLIDKTVASGNLIPLAYISIPILISSFFSPIWITILIGFVQSLGMLLFIISRGFDLRMGGGSLLFFGAYIFAASVLINIQNRRNRHTIAKQLELLKEYAIRDPLTGLYNRRFPLEFLQNELERLKREKGTLSIVIFDIDNFKYFNDTYGHYYGDEILITISNLIVENFRKSDIICRWGGDEFLIAMNDVEPLEASSKIKNLQELIGRLRSKDSCDMSIQVTISVGIAAYPRNGETVHDLLKVADEALYQAKEKGKNSIVLMD
jgi:diguanylate cyclase (GGDEF)-like protein